MTKRDKIVVLSSAVLAAAVIASVVVVGTKSAGWNQSSSFPLGVGLIVLSLLSVGFVFFRLVRKSSFEKRLKPEFFIAYQGMKDGINNSELRPEDRREALSDILEILISAQENGKPVDQAIPDPLEFTQEVIEAYTNKRRRGLFFLLNGGVAFLSFVVLVHTLLWLEDPAQSFFSQKIDYNMLFLFAAVAFAVLPLVKQLSARQTPWMYIVPLLSGILFIGLMEALRHLFYHVALVKAFLDGAASMIPNAVILGGYLLVILLLVLAKRMIRRRLTQQEQYRLYRN